MKIYFEVIKNGKRTTMLVLFPLCMKSEDLMKNAFLIEFYCNFVYNFFGGIDDTTSFEKNEKDFG